MARVGLRPTTSANARGGGSGVLVFRGIGLGSENERARRLGTGGRGFSCLSGIPMRALASVFRSVSEVSPVVIISLLSGGGANKRAMSAGPVIFGRRGERRPICAIWAGPVMFG